MQQIVPIAEANERLDEGLARECHVFCRYLVKQNPTPYVIRKYQNGHTTLGMFERKRAIDPVLLRIAGLNAVFTRLADTYARFFVRRSQLHTKLVLLLAILESTSQGAPRFHRRDAGFGPTVYARLLLALLGFVITVPASLVVFLPLHAVAVVAARARGRRLHAPIAALDRV